MFQLSNLWEDVSHSEAQAVPMGSRQGGKGSGLHSKCSLQAEKCQEMEHQGIFRELAGQRNFGNPINAASARVTDDRPTSAILFMNDKALQCEWNKRILFQGS